MWFTAIAQLVQQEAATPMLNTTNPYAASMQQSSTSPWVAIGVLVGALAVGGGVYYVLRSNR